MVELLHSCVRPSHLNPMCTDAFPLRCGSTSRTSTRCLLDPRLTVSSSVDPSPFSTRRASSTTSSHPGARGSSSPLPPSSPPVDRSSHPSSRTSPPLSPRSTLPPRDSRLRKISSSITLVTPKWTSRRGWVLSGILSMEWTRLPRGWSSRLSECWRRRVS